MSNPFGAIGAMVGVGTAIAGTEQSIEAARYKASAESATATYQAGVATQNAAIAAQEATTTEAAGVIPVQQVGLAAGQTIGAEKAGFGEENVAITPKGSSGRVLTSQVEAAQASEGVATFNTAQKAYGQKVESATDTAQAGLYKSEASTAITAGEISAQAALISGAGNVASKFAQMGTSFGLPGSGAPAAGTLGS
jgi:hypothetical protein